MNRTKTISLILAVCMLFAMLPVFAAATEVDISTLDGAAVRTMTPQGLRFTSSIKKADITDKEVVEFGTLLIPTADITDPDDFVIDAVLNGHAVAKVRAHKIYAETEDSYQFTAVITSIEPENYTRAYSARAYAICKDGTVIYASMPTSRDVYTVAVAALADGSGLSDEAIGVLTEIKDLVEAPTLTTIELTLDEPAENEAASTTIGGVATDAPYTVEASWTTTGGAPFAGTVVSGTTYTVTIKLTRTEGTFNPAQTVSLNGEARPITLSQGKTVLTVKKSYDFKDAGYTPIY